jgi:hypothetical protein
MAGVQEGSAGKQKLTPPAPLPALLYGRTPTFTNLALYATALANFVLPSTICTGHLKRRDRKRIGHSGLGLLIRYTATFSYSENQASFTTCTLRQTICISDISHPSLELL